jgi:hypothetical protein
VKSVGGCGLIRLILLGIIVLSKVEKQLPTSSISKASPQLTTDVSRIITVFGCLSPLIAVVSSFSVRLIMIFRGPIQGNYKYIN